MRRARPADARALQLQGGTLNGCNIAKVSASHTGGTLSEMRVTLRNRGTRPVRIAGDTELSGGGQCKIGTLRRVQNAPGQTAVADAATPMAARSVGRRCG